MVVFLCVFLYLTNNAYFWVFFVCFFIASQNWIYVHIMLSCNTALYMESICTLFLFLQLFIYIHVSCIRPLTLDVSEWLKNVNIVYLCVGVCFGVLRYMHICVLVCVCICICPCLHVGYGYLVGGMQVG